MDPQEVRAFVKDLERVIEQGDRFAQTGDRLGHTLAILFAMRSAYAIGRSIFRGDDEQMDAAKVGAQVKPSCKAPRDLPKLSNVRAATPRLIDALASNSRVEISLALRDSGICDLCPIPHEQLLRLDLVGRTLRGRVLQVSLVELALFAVEVGDWDSASKYVAEALRLAPGAWELHNLRVLEGLFAFRVGQTRDAVNCLNRSIAVCLADEYACLDCGVRAPNFMLAQEFLQRGDPRTVVEYLSQCRIVWHSFWLPISKLMDLIETGETVNLQACDFVRALNQSSYKLQMHWVRARCLEEAAGLAPYPQIPRSPEEVVEARTRLLEKSQSDISDRVKQAIKYLENDGLN